MRKHTSQHPLPPLAGAAKDRKTDQILARLRLYHRIGRTANRNANKLHSAMPSEELLLRVAQEHGINEVTLRKARAFAREYSAADFKEFRDLRRPNGQPLHWGYVPYLLLAESKTHRKALQRQVVEYGWTPPQLYAEIRRQRPEPKRRGGRPLKNPSSPGHALTQLIAAARLWLKRRELVGTDLAAIRPEDLGAKHQQARSSAIAVLKQLAQAAENLGDQLASTLPAQKKHRGAKKQKRK
jgi:hypothetical protein